MFVFIAFSGVIPGDELRTTLLHAWVLKVAYETVATPVTYLVVGFLKREDQSDVYDYDTNFNPLSLR